MVKQADSALWFPLTEDGSALSSQYGVLPLLKGQEVKYKLIEADKKDPQRTEVVDGVETGRYMMKTPGYTMTGKKIIFDAIQGRTVTITNKVLSKSIKTPLGDIPSKRPESVKFLSDKPVITVRSNQPELYAFLERANENIDNPFRDPTVPAMYYRVDPHKKVAKANENDAFEFKALKWVQETATYEKLKACAEYIKKVRPDVKIKTDYTNAEASNGFGLLKRELYELAKTDPKNVLKGADKKEEIFEMQIRDAERLQIILFSDKMRDKPNTWFHNDETLTSICQLSPGASKYDGLMAYLLKDESGQKHYEKIVSSLEKMLTPR
jgi:hypothetical protein